ncbi:60S ribosomal protein L7-1 [Capsicum galapagoense]
MGDEVPVPQPLHYMPEVILKKRKSNEAWPIRRKLPLEHNVRKLISESFVIKKPQQFICEYRDKGMDLVQMKQRGKRRTKGAMTMSDSKLIFVICIGGKSDMHPRKWKFLYSLRLRKIFSGGFVKGNERTMEILQKIPQSEEREGSDLQEKFW